VAIKNIDEQERQSLTVARLNHPVTARVENFDCSLHVPPGCRNSVPVCSLMPIFSINSKRFHTEMCI
jgi:hypothetical protein